MRHRIRRLHTWVYRHIFKWSGGYLHQPLTVGENGETGQVTVADVFDAGQVVGLEGAWRHNVDEGCFELFLGIFCGWDALPILEQVTKEEGDFTLGGLPFGVAKEEIRGASESILNNAYRVERVIQDLRAYNLGERNELSPGVSVNRVVEEALTIIRAHGRQGEISITPTLAASLPNITGNQCQLEQVVVNLLLNAMQATPNNRGAVTIRTHYSAESAEVLIAITDQGEGISPAVKKRLFEAFFSTRIDKGGSGLGLYISNFIVTEHKGRLTVESGDISGTVATVHLPVADAMTY